MTGAPDAVHSLESQLGGIDEPSTISVGHRILVASLVVISFFAYGAVRAPVPAVNEPHYLAKAKHYWNPEWCPGDFFLESSNAHLVFYQTFGLPTVWLSLEQTAWLGRAIGAILLAIGWTRLVFVVLPNRWSPLWGVWGFLFLQACGNLSGEWIAGGIESKVPAYGFLFWSVSHLLERSWNRAAFLAGLAISFHPVVGLWGVIAAFGALAWTWLVSLGSTRNNSSSTGAVLKQFVVSVLILAAASLPGLVPALLIVGVNSFAADYIQVYYRLDHHLDPMQFSAFAEGCYFVLLSVWLVAVMAGRSSDPQRMFRRFVLMTAAIAIAGLAAGHRTGLPEEMTAFAFRMKLLKLYPFRLFDAILPIAAAVAAVRLFDRLTHAAMTGHFGRMVAYFGWSLFGTAMMAALLLPSIDRNASRLEPTQLADWKDACRWISQNTPTNAVVFTPPRESWAFKWYAERAEFVSFKDCPQNADGIVQWNRRLLWIQDWAQRTYGDGLYTADDLRELYNMHGITHVLAGRLGPMENEPIYQNGTYRVYSLVEANDK